MTDERAVSPVIGVILMVAIAVILSAVVGTFVLDYAQDRGEASPQVSLTVEATTGANTLTVEHLGGDALADDRTRVTVSNDSEKLTFPAGTGSDQFTVGDSFVINASNGQNATLVGAFGNRTITGETMKLESGTAYTIAVIDTQTQRTVYQHTITA